MSAATAIVDDALMLAALAARELQRSRGDRVAAMIRLAYRLSLRPSPLLPRAATQAAMADARRAMGVARWPSGSDAVEDAITACCAQRRAMHEGRCKRRESSAEGSEGATLAKRFDALTCLRVREALAQCDYRKAQGRWAGGEHETIACISVTGMPYAAGRSERVFSRNGKWSGKNSTHVIRVLRTWLHDVHRHGIAVINRQLVVDAAPTGGGRWDVAYVRQGRGFDLIVTRATLTRRPDGTFQLRNQKG